jgi:hypothetical protein
MTKTFSGSQRKVHSLLRMCPRSAASLFGMFEWNLLEFKQTKAKVIRI